MPDTELAFLEMEQALAQPLCPVCRVLRRAEERYIWSMLYERGLDPASRLAFDAARGFCRPHAALAAQVVQQRALVSGARLAVWYESVVQTYLEHTRKRVNTPCPACSGAEVRLGGELRALGRMLEREGYRTAYQRSEGLCVPHFERMPESAFLRKDQSCRLTALRERLYELQRKQAHDVLEAVTPAENVSWQEALWRFTGVAWEQLLVEGR